MNAQVTANTQRDTVTIKFPFHIKQTEANEITIAVRPGHCLVSPSEIEALYPWVKGAQSDLIAEKMSMLATQEAVRMAIIIE